MADAIIDTRLTNALFPNAQVSRGAETLAGAVAPAGAAEVGQLVLASFAAAYGGLWVGGKTTLTQECLVFEPNFLNRIIHENGAALRMELPLEEVESVTTRFGFFTGLIDVSAQGTTFTLRCYGSKSFAEKVREAAEAKSTRRRE
jgi:hypothetical protein